MILAATVPNPSVRRRSVPSNYIAVGAWRHRRDGPVCRAVEGPKGFGCIQQPAADIICGLNRDHARGRREVVNGIADVGPPLKTVPLRAAPAAFVTAMFLT
jgi:hypothetical protein